MNALFLVDFWKEKATFKEYSNRNSNGFSILFGYNRLVMNILFFLIPKSQVAYAEADSSIRQVVEKLSYHHYTAIPLLSKDGKYVRTISEGDIFWFIKNERNWNYKNAEEAPISMVSCRRTMESIRFDADRNDLLHLAINQNFVPVLDENGIFMGIITRKSIILYFAENNKNIEKKG